MYIGIIGAGNHFQPNFPVTMRAASLPPQCRNMRSRMTASPSATHNPIRCLALNKAYYTPAPALGTKRTTAPANLLLGHGTPKLGNQGNRPNAGAFGTPSRRLACASSSSASAASSGGGDGNAPVVLSSLEQQAASFCAGFTRLFPLWVILAAVSAFHAPHLYLWFDNTCVTYGLMFVMAGMGLTLTFKEIISVFTKQPQLLLLGMVLQYTVLPIFGYFISRYLSSQPGLAPGLAVGVALVSCMPGGTASNIVAYIAKGDMPLSIMMTTASTLMAIATTPLLTSLLVGTLVPVDPRAMFISVLQLVLAPVLAGTAINQFFPAAVARVKLYTPFLATVVVFFIVGSMIAANVAVVASSGVTIVAAVFALHSTGFFLGYALSKALGLSDRIARTNSIEVGMQSSALAAVLAKVHFAADPVVVAPCVLSACTHATVGSLLAGYWAATVKTEDG